MHFLKHLFATPNVTNELFLTDRFKKHLKTYINE